MRFPTISSKKKQKEQQSSLLAASLCIGTYSSSAHLSCVADCDRSTTECVRQRGAFKDSSEKQCCDMLNCCKKCERRRPWIQGRFAQEYDLSLSHVHYTHGDGQRAAHKKTEKSMCGRAATNEWTAGKRWWCFTWFCHNDSKKTSLLACQLFSLLLT